MLIEVIEFLQIHLYILWMLISLPILISLYFFSRKNRTKFPFILMKIRKQRKIKRRFWFLFFIFYVWCFEVILEPDYFLLWEEIIWW